MVWLRGYRLPPRGGSLEKVAPSRGRLSLEAVQPSGNSLSKMSSCVGSQPVFSRLQSGMGGLFSFLR